MYPEGTSRGVPNHTSPQFYLFCLSSPITCAYTNSIIPHSLQNNSSLRMENQNIAQVVKKFDNFVQFSLNNKDATTTETPPTDNKVDIYLREMEKRLKLRPKSHEQKFQKLLKPMKELKSFVSVKEFMESLGERAVGKVSERVSDKQQKALKVGYQNARGGYYMQPIEQHLKNKKFKRSTRNSPLYVTQPEDHSLETSEYRTWIQNTLNKITPKNDHFFKKTEDKVREVEIKTQNRIKAPEKDCLIEQHQKEYADQFKVVPRMRELCNQEYLNFAKISSLLTGRLRKILKNNGTGKKSTISLKPPPFIENFYSQEQKQKSQLRKSARMKQNKQIPRTSRKTVQNKRVQTAGPQRREDSDEWKDIVANKLQNIIRQSMPVQTIILQD